MQPPLADFLAHDPFVAALAQAIAFVLLIRFLDVWEQEPLWIVGALVLWGMFGAAPIALAGNAAVMSLMSKDVEAVWGAAMSAPLVEEVAKGIGLVIAVWVSQWAAKRLGIAEFDGPIDGIVLGASIGIGFAFAENVFYADNRSPDGTIAGSVDVLHFRQGFLGLRTLGHGIYTACLGAGIGMATWSRSRRGRIGFPLLGLATAVFLHTVWNGLQSVVLVREYGFDTTAAALRGRAVSPDVAAEIAATNNGVRLVLDVWAYTLVILFFFGLYFLTRYQRRILLRELTPEVEAGLLTESELSDVCSYGRRLRQYGHLLGAGKLEQLIALRKAHAQLVDLGFWKWRVRRVGGDERSTDRRRRQISALREEAAAGETPA